MDPQRKEQFIAALNGAISEAERVMAVLNGNDNCDDDSHIENVERVTTLCRAAIERACPSLSSWRKQLGTVLDDSGINDYVKARKVVGIARALVCDLRNGYLESAEELIHADLFSDYLEMARHVLDEGYKDPAAVIIGSSLEAHLRLLCTRAGVPTEEGPALGEPKKASRMNDDLKGAGTYEKLDHKSVTAWLDLRNKAAHGKYGEYETKQVDLMLSGVRDFIQRNPA